MWDLLFGKPKKRYYKPKNKRIVKQGKVTNKKVGVLNEGKKSMDIISKEKLTKKDDVWKNLVKEEPVLKNNIRFENSIDSDILQQKTVADIEIYNTLVERLMLEMSHVFMSAFLAKTDNHSVLKSWFMKDNQSLLLSKIFINTNQFLTNQSQAKIKSYAILDLDEHKMLFTLKLDSYQFTIVVNSDETSVGYLISIIKPIIEKYIKNN